MPRFYKSVKPSTDKAVKPASENKKSVKPSNEEKKKEQKGDGR